MNINKRLPAVRPLSSQLPKGVEGGKEFGRIVGLLLLNDAKRHGLEFALYDDAAGDFEGLDSYSHRPKAREAIGYQYKFFSSPFSDAHRAEIVNSIQNAAARTKHLKLVKWTLVTPDDLLNSATRKGGGDVEWFQKLKEVHRLNFELEHIGHSKIINMFLQAHYLCLFYYPELLPGGVSERQSIQELRSTYDSNMKARFGRIEFVGMSVYKDETSRRIPLEDIYISLSLLAERAPTEDDETPRVDPVALLSPGQRSIVLGDPGSGKSTLLSFLALVGISKDLRMKYSEFQDSRLTVVVTLRRYADEIKERTSLTLTDYILETAKADFNMDGLHRDFYSYYFESGKAIILFDGLDELPGSSFKLIIKQRIESFCTTYPETTIIITSRLVGYEAEVRFDDSYGHFRMAKLKPNEIEKFIQDWYSARIDDVVESNRNARDLIRVIRNADNEAIRDLARNPLLLTIVTLVHRIDAVLPDQRVILYQKCTETLLNTWYKAKRRDDEAVKGRVERRNRLRIEAIAYWMQAKSLGNHGRSVVPYEDLVKFLTQHIIDNERIKESEDPAEDQAEIFINFIKNSAGLLVEAGDEKYSFIHLTFQEYLCATRLSAFGEVDGAQSIWDELGGNLQHPRWREVIRLLVASLKSMQGQKFFVEKLLNVGNEHSTRDNVLLLMGLLRDAIEPAEECAHDILCQAIRNLMNLAEPDDIRNISNSVRSWVDKDGGKNREAVAFAFDAVFETASAEHQYILSLVRSSLNLPALNIIQQQLVLDSSDCHTRPIIQRMLIGSSEPLPDQPDLNAMDVLHAIWSMDHPEANVTATIGQAIALLIDKDNAHKRIFMAQISLLPDLAYGPHLDYGLNLVCLAIPAVKNIHPAIIGAAKNALIRERRKGRYEHTELIFSRALQNLKSRGRGKSLSRRESNGSIGIRDYWRLRAKTLNIDQQASVLDKAHRGSTELQLIRAKFVEKIEQSPSWYLQRIRSSEGFARLFPLLLKSGFKVSPLSHWGEALQYILEDKIPGAFSGFFEKEEWDRIEKLIGSGEESDKDRYFAAWLLIFDIWLWNNGGYDRPEDSPFVVLAEKVDQTFPPLQLAAAFRAAMFDSTAVPQLDALMRKSKPSLDEIFESVGWRFARSPKPESIARTRHHT